ncbi:MAG: hypothetical protein PHQ27_08430, partial [Victivallales bacterium]|nr:hypothetical protein [Victivallales bacterium]
GKPFPKATIITCLTPLADGSVIGISHLRNLFRFDPKTRQVVARENFSWYAPAAHDQGPRDIFTHDGNYYLLLRKGIASFDPATGKIMTIAPSPVPIRNGGAVLGDRLFWVSKSHIWSLNLKDRELFLSPDKLSESKPARP